MPIPKLQPNGELPAGEFLTTLKDIERRYAEKGVKRKQLMQGLKLACVSFKKAGVPRVWANGSFITDKAEPADIDGCWEYTSEVDLKKLDPVFLMTSRRFMKEKFGLDFFPAHLYEAKTDLPFPEFFRINREGEPKGILVIHL